MTIPSHHPYSETLVSYASGTLPSAVACVVACHLSMCSECAEQIGWLERLGGAMLSNVDTGRDEAGLTDRIVARRSYPPRSCEPRRKSLAAVADLLLPMPLAYYVDVSGAEVSWMPAAGGIKERSIELPKDSGSIKLLRLSAGQLLPEHDVTLETEVALVLQGACRDSAGTYVRGDIIEWAKDEQHRPMAAGQGECVCLIADQATG